MPRADVRFCDTVCQPTKDRQLAMSKLVVQAELIVVVGGHASNNTRQLVLAARTAGRRAYQIERPEELDARWFRHVETVGLTAGTSTLPETVRAVHARLEQIARGRREACKLTPIVPGSARIRGVSRSVPTADRPYPCSRTGSKLAEDHRPAPLRREERPFAAQHPAVFADPTGATPRPTQRTDAPGTLRLF